MVLALNAKLFGDIGQGYSLIKPLSTIANISLLKPNGGELFYVGATDTIKWSSTNIANVKIELTTNNGTNWLTIIESTPASTGSYLWEIPNTPSLNCKVRVSDAGSPSINADSDSLFTIMPVNAIVYGGKIYNTVTIGTQTWLKENLDIGTMIQGSSNPTNNSLIEKYCYDNNPTNCETYGGLYQWNEAMQYVTTPGAQGICPTGWHIPRLSEFQTLANSVGNNSNALKAIGQGSGSGSGTNTSGFSVLLAGDRYYNNGTFYSLGLKAYLWTSKEYDTNNSYGVGLYGSDGLVYYAYDNKNYGYSIRCLQDIPPSVQLNTPNGGEIWIAGTQQNITWTSVSIDSVKLEYSTNNGNTWTTITQSTTASNSPYAWTLPNVGHKNYIVRISDVLQPSVNDVSDASFTIQLENGLVAYYPFTGNANDSSGNDYHGTNSGAILTTDRFGNANSAYSFNGTSNRIVTPSTIITAPFTISVWVKTQQTGGFPSGLGTVIATGYYHGGYGRGIILSHGNQSSSYYKFPENIGWGIGVIDSVSPINNNKWRHVVGTWDGTADSSGVKYYIDGKLVKMDKSKSTSLVHDFNLRIGHSSDGPYNYYHKGEIDDIKIYNRVLNSNEVISLFNSNNWFPPSITISAPNGGEVLVGGVNYNLRWLSDSVDYVKIEYTTNGGALWELINDSVSSLGGKFTWAVPELYSTNCKIRIKSTLDSTLVDVSDGKFTITFAIPSTPTLASPSNYATGQKQPVSVIWNKALRSERYIFHLSTDSLFANVLITDSTLTDTTKLLQPLSNYVKYYWRIKAVNIGGQSDWSEVWNFKTLGNPYASNLITPLNISLNQPISGLVFKWTKPQERIETIQKYQYQLSTDSLFASFVINDTTVTDTTKTINSLNYLTKYFWRVRASNETGWGDWSETWRFTTLIEKPTVPVLATPADNSKGLALPLTIKWNKSLRAEKYRLQVSANAEFSTLIVNDSTITDTSRILQTLTNYSQYYWRVKAYNNGGESSWSTAFSFKTLGNPYASYLIAPANLSVNQPVSQLIFKWTKANERIETIQKYQFQLAADSLFTSTVVNDTTLTDTLKTINGLSYLTNYYWRVRAQNPAGWGDWSETWRYTTIIEKPTVPLLAIPANNSKGLLHPITAKWNRSLRAEKYRLQVSQNAAFTSIILNDSTVSDTSKILPILTNYYQYYWRVRAVNIGGESNWSDVWNFKTLGNPYAGNLITPLNISLNQPISGLVFKWTKPQERIETIQKYQYQLSTDSLFASFVVNDTTLTDTTKTINSLNYLTNYFWRVRAQNQTGWGDWSERWKFTTIIEKPVKPLLASPANNSKGLANPVMTKWLKTPRAAKYILQVSDSPAFGSFTFIDSTITDSLKTLPVLQNYYQYYWRVKAVNAGGESDWSEVWNFKTLGNPYASSLIEPGDNSINQTISGLIFKWTKPLERIETIQKYQYQLSTDSLFGSFVINDTSFTDTTRTVNNLTYLTKYFWRVRAGNQAGWGDWSEVSKFTTFNNTTLITPNGNEQIAAQSSSPITWTETILQNVKLDYSTNSGLSWLNITPSTSASALSYSWNVPLTFSSQCKIRVTGVEQPLITDESDQVFSIINNRPEINFAEIPNYQNEVVYPTTGSDETLFEYIIKYSSAENKPPYPGFPKIVLDFNGNVNITDPGEGEFTMTPVDLTDTTYTDGKLYSYLTMLPLGGNHKVKFIGADADGDTAVVNQALLQYRSVPLVLGGLPDAVVEASDIVFSNENPNPSQPFTMTTKVYNRSDQNMENVKVKFYKDNTLIGEQIIPYLSHRTETTVSLQTVINESGFYAMIVKVDPDNTIPEKNEFNNIALRPHVIGTTPIFGNIAVTALPAVGYSYATFFVRGFAKYTGVFGGDQMVLGGSVKVTIEGVNYFGTTNSNGEFSVKIYGLPVGSYQATIQVTDTRLTGNTTTSVQIINYSGGQGVPSGKDVALVSMQLSNESPTSGEQINIVVRARNVGTESLNNIVVHLYTDNILKDSVLIPSLGIGSFSDHNFTATFYGVGNHSVYALADPRNEIPEVNENNNSIVRVAVIRADKPDLVVPFIERDEIIKVERSTTFFARVKNIGGVAVSTPFVVYFEVNGVEIGQKTVNSIGVDGTSIVGMSTTFTTPGVKLLKVYADYTNVIVESDETNNIGGISFYVYPLLPNLTFKTGSMVSIPSFPGIGQDVNFHITAKNDGEIISPLTQVRYTINGLSYSSLSNVPQLNPGQEVLISSTVPWQPGFEATFISKAEIDFDNQIEELNELDNAMTLGVVVGYGSDLALDSANHIKASKFYAHPGETVQLSALVNNHGTIYSTGNVEFYYINNNSQRVYINSAIVSVPANDTATSSSVSFTLPFAPINIFAKLVNSQPADYNLNNNEQTLLIGDRAPQIIGLDTLIFAEDSSLTISLNDYVFDGGDSSSTLIWEFTPSPNVFTSYQQSNQTLRLTATPDFYGTENITVKVRDPRFNYTSKNVSVVVTQVIDYPGTPVLVSPVSGSVGMIQPLAVTWKSSTYTDKYYLQAATDSLFSTIVISDSSITDTVKSISGLAHYTKHYWRVKGINSEAHGEWSDVWNFKTLGSAFAVELVGPVDNSILQPVNGLVFRWKKPQERIETILKYQYQISQDSLFGSFTINDSLVTDTVKQVSNLIHETAYFWRVRAGNEAGWGDWSQVWRLRTIIDKPSVPVLASPLNNANMQVQPVLLKWNRAERAERYILEVSENSGFTSFFLRDSMITDSFKTLPQLQFPKTYYWRVRASNIGGTSAFSAVWNFRTLGLPLAVDLVSPAHNSINQPVNNLPLVWKKAGEQTLIAGAIRRNTTAEEDGNIYRESPVTPLRSGSKNSNGNTLSDNPAGISTYWLQVSGDTSGTVYIVNDSTLTDTTKLISGLNFSTPYFWRVMAKNENGWGAFSGWFSFSTIIERPSRPLLASPSNGSTGQGQPVELSWNAALRADIYTLQVSESPLFTGLVHIDSLLTDTAVTLPPLSTLRQYYWRINARNLGGISDTSEVWSFKTRGTPAVLTLVYPAQNAINIPVAVNFKWLTASSTEEIYRYWFEHTLDTSGAQINRDSTLTDTTVTITLLNGTVNFWRVKAGNEAGWGAFSQWHRFTTLPLVTAAPLLGTPVNNAVSVPRNPKLVWHKTPHADWYHLQVSTSQTFTTLLVNLENVTDTSSIIDSLNYKTAYYWRVRGGNISGYGPYSGAFKFITVFRPIAAPGNLTATAIAHRVVRLSWVDNAPTARYMVQRKQGDSTSSNQLITLANLGPNTTQYNDSTVADSVKYSYRVYATNSDTTSPPSNYAVVLTLTDVTDYANGTVPEEYTIQQNYPNPFNPSTTIRYGLPYDSEVRLEIFDISGQKLQTLVDQAQSAGYYEAVFDISGMSSGTYLYILTATRLDGDGEFHQVKKMILLK